MGIKLTNHLHGEKKYELREVLLHKTGTAPTSPVSGQMYFNTTDSHHYVYNGTAWKKLTDQSMTANEILIAVKTVDGAGSELDADLLDGQHGSYYLNTTTPLNSVALPTGAVSLNGQKITNMAETISSDPSTNAATKGYVDSEIQAAVQGLDVKPSVLVATTAELSGATLTGSVLTVSSLTVIDGVTLTVGDRILVKNQTSKVQNGFYTYTNATTLTRTGDFGSAIQPNAFVFVEQGTTNADTGWVLSSGAGVVGVNNIEFTQFSSAGVIQAGTYLTKSGNTLDINVSTVARKQVNLIGDGTATEFTISTFGTEDKIAIVREVSTGEQVLADVVHLNAVQTKVIFAEAPTTNQYKVTIIG